MDNKKNFATITMVVGTLLILAGLGMAFRNWQELSLAATGDPVVVAVTATRTLVPTYTPAAEEPPPAEAPALLPEFPGAESPEKPVPAREKGSVPRSASPTPVTVTPTPVSVPPATAPPDRLVIPSIQLDATVVPMGWRTKKVGGKTVSEWVVPENAAGWHKNSALPGHGENVVMSGHHNIKGEVFRYLADVKVGDDLDLYVGPTVYPYRVTETYILKEKGQPLSVRQHNARFIQPSGDERLTLVSCWPYTNNTHRVIVVAKPRNVATQPENHGAEK